MSEQKMKPKPISGTQDVPQGLSRSEQRRVIEQKKILIRIPHFTEDELTALCGKSKTAKANIQALINSFNHLSVSFWKHDHIRLWKRIKRWFVKKR